MSTEKKIIGIITLTTVLILIIAVFLLSKNSSSDIPEDQILSRNGIHWHPKVSINISGKKQPLPIGIGLSGPVHNPIHTHEDADKDIVHMEFEGIVTKDQTKLKNFFKIWGKDFNVNKILDQEATISGTIKMFVNGKQNPEFENYQMRDGDNIEIRYE